MDEELREVIWVFSSQENVFPIALAIHLGEEASADFFSRNDEGGREDGVAERLLKPPCVNGDDVGDKVVVVSQSLRPSAEGEGVDMELSALGLLTGKDRADTVSAPGSLSR